VGPRRIRRWALVVGLAVAAACTGDGGGGGELEVSDTSTSESTVPDATVPGTTVPDAELQEFCDAYDAFVEANQTDVAVDELRVVVELAPPGTEAHVELLLPLMESMAVVDPESDLTGSMDHMSLVIALREPGPRRAEERLYEILADDCGRDVGIVLG
jgi:hypothetical protein